MIVNENSVVEMEADGLGEDGFFEVSAFADQVGDRVAVIDSGYVLVDDGAFVKIGGGIVCGGADEFDSTGVGLMVRLAPGKGG